MLEYQRIPAPEWRGGLVDIAAAGGRADRAGGPDRVLDRDAAAATVRAGVRLQPIADWLAAGGLPDVSARGGADPGEAERPLRAAAVAGAQSGGDGGVVRDPGAVAQLYGDAAGPDAGWGLGGQYPGGPGLRGRCDQARAPGPQPG